MNKNRTRGPAWKVRQDAREKLIRAIRGKINEWENDFDASDLYRIFLLLLNKRLGFQRIAISSNDLPDIVWGTRELVFSLFHEVSVEIEGFQRTETEGYGICAELLEWSAYRVRMSYQSVLREQQLQSPELVYGVKNATDMVPLE